MKPWSNLFLRPAGLTTESAELWFAGIADYFLNHARWLIAGTPHRLIDIEFYYRFPDHDDPFAHADPIQAEPCRWYFHKTGNGYRGGSFKGLDLTIGDGEARGGILFRAAETPDGRIIDGPSLLVDHVLRLCKIASVAELDRKIAKHMAWHPECPIKLQTKRSIGKSILASARIGLSLRRAGHNTEMPTYLTRQYRFLTEPRAISKGKAQMVMSLHRQGFSPSQIRSMTGCPARAIERYVAEYALGKSARRIEGFFGKVLSARDLCRLHGIADRG
jgi:hypothetical protein